MEVRTTRRGSMTVEEAIEWLDAVLADHANLTPRGIKVSNSLHQRGLADRHRGVRIAMSRELYPDDGVVVVFDDER